MSQKDVGNQRQSQLTRTIEINAINRHFVARFVKKSSGVQRGLLYPALVAFKRVFNDVTQQVAMISLKRRLMMVDMELL